MITKIFRVFSVLLVGIGMSLGVADIVSTMRSQSYVTNMTISKRADVPKQKFTPRFTEAKEGIQNVVYITMVKDEDDIIYENLMWHFAVGFRKFIIFDNSSTDNTLALIKRFVGETKDFATVLVVEDPIVGYNQNKITTAGYRMAHEIWPEVKWFFPVDADEFWIFSQAPAAAIAMIPDDADVVSALRLRYHPSDDYDAMAQDAKFWHKLHHRDNQWEEFDVDKGRYTIIPKMFLRYSDNFSIGMGSHSCVYKGMFSIKADEDDEMMHYNIIDNVNYVAADLYGMHMREYHMRSPEQTQRKFSNGMKAAFKIEDTKKNGLKAGIHWIDYKEKYLDKAKTPEEAAAAKFKTYYRPSTSDDVIDDPLPIDDAIALYRRLCDLG